MTWSPKTILTSRSVSLPGNGFEAGLFGGLRIQPAHVVLELAHQEQDAHDDEWPHDENREQGVPDKRS